MLFNIAINKDVYTDLQPSGNLIEFNQLEYIFLKASLTVDSEHENAELGVSVDLDFKQSIVSGMSKTIEERRAQISSRSNIVLAASLGILLLATQMVIEIWREPPLLTTIAVFMCFLLLGASTIVSLDLVKAISRKNVNSYQSNRENIFYFGWIAKQSEEGITNLIESIDDKKFYTYNIRQIISLSKNLEYRYTQLKKSYFLYMLGLISFIISVLLLLLSV